MSEKRFKLSIISKETKIWRITDKKGLSIITLKGAEERLNDLSDENEQLRQSIEDYGELEYELKKCREKNKELQMKLDKVMEKLDQYRYDETLYAKEIVKLNKEVKDNKFLRLGNDY